MDGTTDLLLPLIKERKEVFRFNADTWKQYQIDINETDFCFKDPTGRIITQESCSGLYIRKAYFLDEDRAKPAGGDIETWCQHQIKSVIDGIYWICKNRDIVRLVERNADRRLPKIIQMRIATPYFLVPRWTITTSPQHATISEPTVCKPLSSMFVEGFQTLFTTKCAPSGLDPAYPWFIQEYVDAESDMTSVYAAGKIFSFLRSKIPGEAIDFKEAEAGQTQGWEIAEIPRELETAIKDYMNELKLDFGRLDFIVKDGLYYFLEVNPNGQFAWLDPDNKTGLLSWITECITTKMELKAAQ